MKELNTTKEVIQALGGDRWVVTLLPEITIQTVRYWRHKNKFPARTYLALKATLEVRGYSAPDSLWNMLKVRRL